MDREETQRHDNTQRSSEETHTEKQPTERHRTETLVQVNGPAKLIIWDMHANCPVREYVFPDDVLPYNNSW